MSGYSGFNFSVPSGAGATSTSTIETQVEAVLRGAERCLFAIYVTRKQNQKGKGVQPDASPPPPSTGGGPSRGASIDARLPEIMSPTSIANASQQDRALNQDGGDKKIVGKLLPMKALLRSASPGLGGGGGFVFPKVGGAGSSTRIECLAVCETEKGSSQLRLHLLHEGMGGKLSVSRTWWLNELARVDGMGSAANVALEFAFVFADTKRYCWAARNSQDRAIFLWSLLDTCASRVGRAPPVEDMRILELQQVADLAMEARKDQTQAHKNQSQMAELESSLNRGEYDQGNQDINDQKPRKQFTMSGSNPSNRAHNDPPLLKKKSSSSIHNIFATARHDSVDESNDDETGATGIPKSYHLIEKLRKGRLAPGAQQKQGSVSKAPSELNRRPDRGDDNTDAAKARGAGNGSPRARGGASNFGTSAGSNANKMRRWLSKSERGGNVGSSDDVQNSIEQDGDQEELAQTRSQEIANDRRLLHAVRNDSKDTTSSIEDERRGNMRGMQQKLAKFRKLGKEKSRKPTAGKVDSKDAGRTTTSKNAPSTGEGPEDLHGADDASVDLDPIHGSGRLLQDDSVHEMRNLEPGLSDDSTESRSEFADLTLNEEELADIEYLLDSDDFTELLGTSQLVEEIMQKTRALEKQTLENLVATDSYATVAEKMLTSLCDVLEDAEPWLKESSVLSAHCYGIISKVESELLDLDVQMHNVRSLCDLVSHLLDICVISARDRKVMDRLIKSTDSVACRLLADDSFLISTVIPVLNSMADRLAFISVHPALHDVGIVKAAEDQLVKAAAKLTPKLASTMMSRIRKLMRALYEEEHATSEDSQVTDSQTESSRLGESDLLYDTNNPSAVGSGPAAALSAKMPYSLISEILKDVVRISAHGPTKGAGSQSGASTGSSLAINPGNPSLNASLGIQGLYFSNAGMSFGATSHPSTVPSGPSPANAAGGVLPSVVRGSTGNMTTLVRRMDSLDLSDQTPGSPRAGSTVPTWADGTQGSSASKDAVLVLLGHTHSSISSRLMLNLEVLSNIAADFEKCCSSLIQRRLTSIISQIALSSAHSMPIASLKKWLQPCIQFVIPFSMEQEVILYRIFHDAFFAHFVSFLRWNQIQVAELYQGFVRISMSYLLTPLWEYLWQSIQQIAEERGLIFFLQCYIDFNILITDLQAQARSSMVGWLHPDLVVESAELKKARGGKYILEVLLLFQKSSLNRFESGVERELFFLARSANMLTAASTSAISGTSSHQSSEPSTKQGNKIRSKERPQKKEARFALAPEHHGGNGQVLYPGPGAPQTHHPSHGQLRKKPNGHIAVETAKSDFHFEMSNSFFLAAKKVVDLAIECMRLRRSLIDIFDGERLVDGIPDAGLAARPGTWASSSNPFHSGTIPTASSFVPSRAATLIRTSTDVADSDISMAPVPSSAVHFRLSKVPRKLDSEIAFVSRTMDKAVDRLFGALIKHTENASSSSKRGDVIKLQVYHYILTECGQLMKDDSVGGQTDTASDFRANNAETKETSPSTTSAASASSANSLKTIRRLRGSVSLRHYESLFANAFDKLIEAIGEPRGTAEEKISKAVAQLMNVGGVVSAMASSFEADLDAAAKPLMLSALWSDMIHFVDEKFEIMCLDLRAKGLSEEATLVMSFRKRIKASMEEKFKEKHGPTVTIASGGVSGAVNHGSAVHEVKV